MKEILGACKVFLLILVCVMAVPALVIGMTKLDVVVSHIRADGVVDAEQVASKSDWAHVDNMRVVTKAKESYGRSTEYMVTFEHSGRIYKLNCASERIWLTISEGALYDVDYSTSTLRLGTTRISQ